MKEELSNLDYISTYETWLAREKRATPNTLNSYLRDVRQFNRWVQQELLSLPQVNQEDVRRYARYLEKAGKSNATVVRSVAALKSFYTYLMSIRVVQINPAKGFTPSFPTARWTCFWSSPIPPTPRAAGIRPCWNCCMPPAYGYLS